MNDGTNPKQQKVPLFRVITERNR